MAGMSRTTRAWCMRVRLLLARVPADAPADLVAVLGGAPTRMQAQLAAEQVRREAARAAVLSPREVRRD